MLVADTAGDYRPWSCAVVCYSLHRLVHQKEEEESHHSSGLHSQGPSRTH